ncbi:MAG: hypothetical protein V2A71_08385 [Candidatus Eisenbacteria bacterium]
MGSVRGRRLLHFALVAFSIALIGAGIAVKRAALNGEGKGPGQELLYFPSGKFLEESALGHESTLADIAWLRAIQYYGHHRLTDQKYELMAHIFDVVTTLDPQFIQAYVFGAIVLSQDAGQPEEAIALLKKGLRNNPENWRLAFETGFVYYLTLRDYSRAGEYFALAARLPCAPEFTSRFAAFVKERAGETETALALWQQAAETTKNKYIREIAEERIRELEKELEKERAGKGSAASTAS